MDFERLASELLRALRGRRSQPAFARRLQYKSNVVYLWESGRAFPSFSGALTAARVAGVDVSAALRAFYGPAQTPDWLGQDARLDDPNVLAIELLADLRGGRSLTDLAQRSGYSRFAIGRWLDGQTSPRLPQALALIEACSLRVLDFVAALVDPEALPSFAQAYRDLAAARRAAYDMPFTQVVVHALELEAYRALPRHAPGCLATLLAIRPEDEHAHLSALLAAGQIRHNGTHYEPTRVQTVDTRGQHPRAGQLKHYFAQLAVDELRDGHEGNQGYNVFAVSRADYARLVELQRSYFAQMRTIIAASQPAELVALASTQLLPLSKPDG